MGNYHLSPQPYGVEPIAKKRAYQPEENKPPKKIKTHNQFEIDDLFCLTFKHEDMKDEFKQWWVDFSPIVRKEFTSKTNLFANHDTICCDLVNKILTKYGLNKSCAINACPLEYTKETPSLSVVGPTISFEKGSIVPKAKYETVLSSLSTQTLILLESVSGVGKTHLSNVITQDLNSFCMIIHPQSQSYKKLESHLLNGDQNIHSQFSIVNAFVISHLLVLLMILQGNIKISKRDYLLFQRNGGDKLTALVFTHLISQSEVPAIALALRDRVYWCLDEAHIYTYLLKGHVPRTDSNRTGSALTLLTRVCRELGPTFLTTTLTGLIEDVHSHISRNFIIPQEQTFSIQILWPEDVKVFLNQMMNLPNNLVSTFVLNQLLGPTRRSVAFFNTLLREASTNTFENVNYLLLHSLYMFIEEHAIQSFHTSHEPISKRYSELKETSVWSSAFDLLVIQGRMLTTSNMNVDSISKLLTKYQICHDFHKTSKQIFLISQTEKAQFIAQLSSTPGGWLAIIWNCYKTSKDLLGGGEMAELLLTYMLTCFDTCIAPILQDHPLLKLYVLKSNFWFHDIPFSKSKQSTNYKTSSFLIKLISSHSKIRTEQMKKWSNKNQAWYEDLPSDNIAVLPGSQLNLTDFLIHPTEEAGPDVLGVLVRRDFVKFLQGEDVSPKDWIENDELMPPYIPLVCSCTIMKGEKLEKKILKDISSTRLENMYRHTTNKNAISEKEFIKSDIVKISSHSLRLLFAPLADTSLSSILGEELEVENVKQVEGEGTIIMMSKHLEGFSSFLSIPLVNEILNNLDR